MSQVLSRTSMVEVAADPLTARRLYEQFVTQLRAGTDLTIETGIFGAHMEIELVNDGPVTFVLDSKEASKGS